MFSILVVLPEKSRVICRFSGWHRALHLMSGNLSKRAREEEREQKPVLTITINNCSEDLH